LEALARPLGFVKRPRKVLGAAEEFAWQRDISPQVDRPFLPLLSRGSKGCATEE
jgi:hypothetical protein